MSDDPLVIEERIAAFRLTVTPNLLAEDDFIDWNAIDREVERGSEDLSALQELIDADKVSPPELATLINVRPGVYRHLLTLIAFNSSGAQVEKWGFPASPPRGEALSRLADQLFYIGIGKLLTSGSRARDLIKVAEVYRDSVRRRFRSDSKLQTKILSIIRSAVTSASAQVTPEIKLVVPRQSGIEDSRYLDYVVTSAGKPILGIAKVFQNQSGGRQQRDLTFTYPMLQERLAGQGLALALIADGAGLIEASDKTLMTLFGVVRYPMSIQEALSGSLRDSIIDAASVEITSVDKAAINRLITTALNSKGAVEASDLPLDRDQAVLALARYVETEPGLDLILSLNGERLAWRHVDRVAGATSLLRTFDASIALSIFKQMFGSDARAERSIPNGDKSICIEVGEEPPFSGSLHVSASIRDRSAAVREVALRSMEDAPASSVAVLLAPASLTGRDAEEHKLRQVVLPANVVILGPNDLLRMAQSPRPMNRLIELVMRQSDLTKVSPYILSNATPDRMFYGREAEAAAVAGTIGTNSVVILGSRRIGKTSLLRKVQADLAEANYDVYFGDCQTVKTWADFADLAASKWEVELPRDFRPSHLSQLAEALAARGRGQVVIVLDEIDQLLQWDLAHTEDTVPEAFFRACRAVSQSGAAQFIFSGERSIAQKMWDPQSPHWNFSRAIHLSQLDEEAAKRLLINPLRSMRVSIVDELGFGNIAWQRTSGHPQIVQYLGDKLVRHLDNQTDRSKLVLTVQDIIAVTDTFEFAEHYIETYWGQSNPLEKAISRLVAQGPKTISALETHLAAEGVVSEQGEIGTALRMLQLYGIVEEVGGEFRARAAWFNEARVRFGGSAKNASLEES